MLPGSGLFSPIRSRLDSSLATSTGQGPSSRHWSPSFSRYLSSVALKFLSLASVLLPQAASATEPNDGKDGQSFVGLVHDLPLILRLRVSVSNHCDRPR